MTREFLESFRNGEKLYQESPFFNKSATFIYNGGDYKEIIVQLCEALDSQGKLLGELANKTPMRPIIIDFDEH